jgi:dolichol-phosphate mannosyltransferase
MLSLVLPTYNEAESLPDLLAEVEAALAGIEHEVIVVDDDSPDGTWRLARELARERPWLHALRRVGRRGLASAVVEGFLSAKGDVLAVADADGQHDPAALRELHAAVRAGAQLAIGSRYVGGGAVGEWDERRQLLSRVATALAHRACRVRAEDPMSGFFAVERSAFEEVLPRLNPRGFKILLDILVHAPAGLRVAELPIAFRVRRRGASKLSRLVGAQFLEYLYEVLLGRMVPLELVKYGLVGSLGVLVNLGAYLLASRLLGLAPRPALFDFSTAVLLAIEAAILSNFLLNNAWTFESARLRGVAALRGFLRYNIACLVGALANYGVSAFAYSSGWSGSAAVVLGGFVGGAWNYSMSRLFTWRV